MKKCKIIKIGNRKFSIGSDSDIHTDNRYFKSWYWYLFLKFLQLSKYIENGDIVLDIGSGPGNLPKMLKFLLKKPKKYVMVDLDKRAIEKAKEFKYNFPVEFHICNALELPFEDNTFDVIIASDVIEHMDEESGDKLLEKCSKILKSDGTLIIVTTNIEKLDPEKDKEWFEEHIKLYRVDELIEKVENHGFRVIEIYGIYGREKDIKNALPPRGQETYEKLKKALPQPFLINIFWRLADPKHAIEFLVVCEKGKNLRSILKTKGGVEK